MYIIQIHYVHRSWISGPFESIEEAEKNLGDTGWVKSHHSTLRFTKVPLKHDSHIASAQILVLIPPNKLKGLKLAT